MRTFMIYSSSARTDLSLIRDLKSAGRIDILLHSIISALFASNKFREDVSLHLFLMGSPNMPRHIKIEYSKENSISKKDLKKLIEIALRKYKDKMTREVHPGVFIDSRGIEEVLEDYNNSKAFMLDSSGKHIKEVSIEELRNPIFILGDHEGFEKKTRKMLKKKLTRLSLGPQIYFTSQAITIINYELDNLG